MDNKRLPTSVKIAIVVAVLVVIVIGLVIYAFFTPEVELPDSLKWMKGLFEKEYTQQDSSYDPIEKTIIYHTADFSENIYNDEAFVELKDLYALEFIDGDSRFKLPEDKLEQYGGDLAVFFYDFFTDIRNGDHDAYNSYFDDRAFKVMKKAEPFTMQQIYEISIEQIYGTPELDEEEYGWIEESDIEPIYVDVRYKIRKNNGTFRQGVESDTVKPQLFIMYKENKTYKIISIVDYGPIYLN